MLLSISVHKAFATCVKKVKIDLILRGMDSLS